MSKEYKAALVLALNPSKRLKKTIVFVHTLAIVAVMANALALAIKINLFSLIGIHCWRTVSWLSAKNYIIKHTEALGWELSEGDDFAPIEILKSTVITTQAVFLHFKYRSEVQSWKSGHKKYLLVVNDVLSDEDYRYLVVKLKTTAIK
jgi:hypothetical protein